MPLTRPQVVSALLRKARNPILVVGPKAEGVVADGKGPLDYVIRLARVKGIPVVANPPLVPRFLERGFEPDAAMSAVEIGSRLADPEWSLKGEPPHDLALILGLTYYVGWVLHSGLKSFAYRHLRTISLDRHYQPQAFWSLPNMGAEEWCKMLEAIVKEVEKG
jgi:acetyl-CoA decarbonylase/synthase complex subunit epsilon